MAEAKLTAVIEAEDRASAVIDGITGKVKSMQPAFKTMAIAGTAAFAGITAAVVVSVKAAADAQVKMAQFNATMETMGAAGVAAKAKLIELADATTQLGFDNEEAANSLAKLYQRTGDVTQASKLLQVSMDLARAKNIDLSSATNLVNMALSGAGRALLQYGIVIKDSATPLEALAVLQEKVGGQATAFADTFTGKMAIMTEQINNTKEAIGDAFIPILMKLLATIQPTIDKILVWVTANPELTRNILIAAAAIAGLVAVVGTLGLVLPAIIAGFTLLAGPLGIIIALIVAIGFAVWQITQIFLTLQKDGALIWEGIKIMMMEKVTAIKLVITTALTAIKIVWEAIWGGVRDFFISVWNAITATARAAVNSITSMLKPVIDMIDKVISKLASIGKSVGGKISDTLKGAGSEVKSLLGINDGIVQNGRVITTNPEDYIIATKTPGALGGGRDININIMGAIFTDDAARMLGDKLIEQLRFQMKF